MLACEVLNIGKMDYGSALGLQEDCFCHIRPAEGGAWEVLIAQEGNLPEPVSGTVEGRLVEVGPDDTDYPYL